MALQKLQNQILNKMQQADTEFKNGNYEKAIEIYHYVINNQQKQPNTLAALLNLSSAYFSSGQYIQCMQHCFKYIKTSQQIKLQPKVQAYILYCRCLIKLKKILTHEEHQMVTQAENIFPSHKVLQKYTKTIKQLQITEDEDQYMDRIFEKLLNYPDMRNYLMDESFLTKVQKIIRNPSLAGALVKTDKRLENVTEIILMAEQDTEESNSKKY